MKLLLLIAIIGVKIVFTEAESSKACKALVDCLETIQEGEQKCESYSKNSTKHSSSRPCKDTTKEAKLKDKKNEQHKEYLACLKSRQAESFTEASKHRQHEECEDVLTEYEFKTSKNDRKKRESTNSTSSTTEKKGHTDSSDNDKDDDKSHHSHHHHHGHEHSEHDLKKECLNKLKHKRNQCKVLTNCCTETKICSLKYKLSKVFTEITQLQLDMALKEHDCKKSNSTSNSGRRFDSPIKSPTDGDENDVNGGQQADLHFQNANKVVNFKYDYPTFSDDEE